MQGMDGVICGHIHYPRIREINGVLYMNDGDWVRSSRAAEGTAWNWAHCIEALQVWILV
jgi:UDP-2,3-diacylglucosamine pyrophosphatase LpxH